MEPLSTVIETEPPPVPANVTFRFRAAARYGPTIGPPSPTGAAPSGLIESLDVSASARARFTRPLPVSASGPPGRRCAPGAPTMTPFEAPGSTARSSAAAPATIGRGRRGSGDRRGAAARVDRDDVRPGAARNAAGAVVGRRRERVGWSVLGDADDAAVAGGEGGGGRAVVAGRRDDDHVVVPGVVDRGLEGARVARVARSDMMMTSAPCSTAQTTPSMMSLSWPGPSAPRTVTGMTLTPA